MAKYYDPNKRYIQIAVDQLLVVDWYPTPEPTGKPQQVHLMIEFTLSGDKESPPLPVSFLTRFKRAQALDRFIESLLIHRESVWGPWKRDKTIAEDLDGYRGGR